MGNNYKNIVRIAVDKNWFDNIFEPERKRLQNLSGKSLSQPKFTSIWAASNMKIASQKSSNKFMPRRPINRRFRFTL